MYMTRMDFYLAGQLQQAIQAVNMPYFSFLQFSSIVFSSRFF